MTPNGVSPPFALFAVVELDQKVINDILEKAKSTSSVNDLWLLSGSDYSDAPQKGHRKVNTGTDPPISDSFKSPFTGRKLSDLVQWLQAKPENVDLDDHYFAILDRKAEAPSESVVLCKIGDIDLQGDTVTCFRVEATSASSFLSGMEYGEWEEMREGTHKKPFAEIDYGDSEEA
ncbi:hypothetical protein HII31_11952 [Pseudocercospora fuligena]|uniref:Uncharacterized protein n=1 Tax=Pseudocercospora fuligena TaxID=685502 RepID=A0A8H6R7G5_9PEZI|nr:hypothetical protein HII31_11952 [Pseudocercospora fuligena]